MCVEWPSKHKSWEIGQETAETTEEGARRVCGSGLYEASVPAPMQTENGPSQQGKNP